jgi:hypothetical protein
VSVVIGGVQVRNNWAHMEKTKKQKIKQRPKCIVLCSGALHPKMGVHPNILFGFFYSLLFNPLLFFIFINCELVVVVYVA